MKHKNLSRGFSHHLLLPIIAVLLVGAIGGYVMLRSSDAASSSACRYKTYAKGAKSECVRYAQYMLGVSHDAIFGSGTQAALVKKTGQSRLNSTAWSKLCSRSYSTTVNKQRDAACKGGKYVTELGNPTIGYRVCTSISYTTPSSQAYEPSKPVCKKRTTYKGAGAKAKAQKQQ